MMPFARKYRPQQFVEVVGQKAVTLILSNAIKKDRIAHAYLLTGSRGTGKTSLARIFSKALRCADAFLKDDLMVSCDQCESCVSIRTAKSLDVLEIDGASYNGVDAVRELRDQSHFLPKTGKKKIYIIDEVHMLTTAAFNALLKILEEPASHLLFVFATTEPHKIPDTILSRCQRFDLKRISQKQIVESLEQILQKESISFESEALKKIALFSQGSMRDALCCVDQIVTFTDEKITLAATQESLSLVEDTLLLKMLEGVLSRNAFMAIEALDVIFNAGYDLSQCLTSFLELVHAQIFIKLGLPLDVLESTQQTLEQLKPLRETEELEMIFQALHQGLEPIFQSQQPKVVFDVLLIKCALAESLVQASQTQPIKNEVKKNPPIPTDVFQQKSVEGFLRTVRQQQPLLASLLEHSVEMVFPLSLDGIFSVAFAKDSLFFDQIQKEPLKSALRKIVSQEWAASVQIRIEGKEGKQSFSEKKDQKAFEDQEQKKEQVKKHPLLVEALSLFGGTFSSLEVKKDA
jgi:DNA polymerase III subunit gamma/tau